MACGTPVVAFANSAIPEVVDGAGVLVPDGDVAAMVSAVAALLADGETLARMATERGSATLGVHVGPEFAAAYATSADYPPAAAR